WGGIHPPIDNFAGRHAGAQVGQGAWALASKYFDGSVTTTPIIVTMQSAATASVQIRCNTLRGMYYKLQSTTDLSVPFTDEPGGTMLATEGWMTVTNSVGSSQKFYRVACSLHP